MSQTISQDVPEQSPQGAVGHIEVFSKCAALRPQIEEIFFQSALKKSFSSDEECQSFRRRWLDIYLDEAPDHSFIYRNTAGEALGYLASWPDSLSQPHLFEEIPYYKSLSAYYNQYPAHFHVNVREDARSRGIGQKLIESFADLCRVQNIAGIHVITSENARNKHFYEKCGLELVHRFQTHHTMLVMLGKKITI